VTVGIAVVGCGMISHEYLRNLTSFPDLDVRVCADLDTGRAAAVAAAYGVPASGLPERALADPTVDIVVNLTVPAAHVEVALAAVAAGKHVYNEKPLALDPDAGRHLLEAAAAAGVRVGGAPDTFLGAGLQTACRLIADGAIGTPHTARTVLQGYGPESWHESPEFFFRPGGGPLFDMGPYYLTALTAALGPVVRVAATARTARTERVIGAGPRAGTRFAVEVPTYVSALLEFADGPAANTLFSFDAPNWDFVFEIAGTASTLRVPDPNHFHLAPSIRHAGESEWREVPPTGPTAGRGLGVLEMARAIHAGVGHRASGERALHVVEIMTAAVESAGKQRFVDITSTVGRAAPLPGDWDPFVRTLP
jgi:predicted dehydrogenase